MKSSTKFWLAIFTFLPLVFLILFFTMFFNVFFEHIVELEYNHGEPPIEFLQSLFWLIPLILLIAMVSLGIKIYYMIHAINHPENDTNKKVIWVLILFFAGLVASIVYFFIEIVPLKVPDSEKVS